MAKKQSWSFPLLRVGATEYQLHFVTLVFLWTHVSTVVARHHGDVPLSLLDVCVLIAGLFLFAVVHEQVRTALSFTRLTRSLSNHRSTSEQAGTEVDSQPKASVSAHSISSRTVTFFPFGAIAEIGDREKEREVQVAHGVAPLVCFLIAMIFDGLAGNGVPSSSSILFKEFAIANWYLGTINLIPLLPFDGGLLLRSIQLDGSEQADTSSQSFSNWSVVGCIALTLLFWLHYEHPILALAFGSAAYVALKFNLFIQAVHTAKTFKVLDAMIVKEDLLLLRHGTSLASALRQSLSSFQSVFPVVKGEQLMGVVERDDMLRASQRSSQAFVTELVDEKLPDVSPNLPLSEVVTILENLGLSYLPVIEDGEFCGLVVKERVLEFLLLQNIEQAKNEDPFS